MISLPWWGRKKVSKEPEVIAPPAPLATTFTRPVTEVFYRGFLAGREGLGMSDNPFVGNGAPSQPMADDWHDGWLLSIATTAEFYEIEQEEKFLNLDGYAKWRHRTQVIDMFKDFADELKHAGHHHEAMVIEAMAAEKSKQHLLNA